MSGCCWLRLLRLPRGWAGVTTYCRCGNLLILRDGAWRSAHNTGSELK